MFCLKFRGYDKSIAKVPSRVLKKQVFDILLFMFCLKFRAYDNSIAKVPSVLHFFIFENIGKLLPFGV